MDRQSEHEQSFIFEDQSSFMCCDSVTTQCSNKIPQRFTKTRLISLGGGSSDAAVIDQQKKDLDEYLATAMKGLSVKERNAALEEVNGIVDNDLENSMEDPAVLDRKLIEMDEHLQSIKNGSVYKQAESMDPDYVQKQEFRLMFLRGKRWDPIEAAKQMLDFFETKLMLFGKEKLCKDITLDDLDEEDRLSIRKGGVQLLQRDVGGRMICTNMRGTVKHHCFLNELRTKYYTFMSMVESEETQKKGVIALWYVVGEYYKDKNGGSGLGKLGKLVDSLPIHWAGFHFCCDDVVQFVLIQALVMTFPKHLAAKFRCHKGTHLECMYALRTYGIPASAVPIPETGDNKPPLLYQHTIWYHNREILERERDERFRSSSMKQQQQPLMHQRKMMDYQLTTRVNIFLNFSLEDPVLEDIEEDFEDPFMDSSDPFTEMEIDTPPIQQHVKQQLQGRSPTACQQDSSPIGSRATSLPATSGPQSHVSGNFSRRKASNTAITPRRSDVLFGSKYTHHPGTLELQQVVSQQLPVFASITLRTEKTKFVGLLLQAMKSSGVRFLAMDKATKQWVEVKDMVARNKVSKAFRNKQRLTGMGTSIVDS